MCDPITIGLMVGGTLATAHGQRQQSRALSSTREAERARQSKIQGEADAAYSKSKQTYAPEKVKGDAAAAVKDRTTEYKSQNLAAPRAASAPSSASQGGNQVVKDAYSRTLGAATAQGDQMGQARAELAGFGDAMFNADLQHGRARDDIGMAASFARGSAGVLGSELEAAQHKGSKMRALGSLLQQAGMVSAGGGFGGGGMGGNTAITGAPGMQLPINYGIPAAGDVGGFLNNLPARMY
jgi:hypothetical protein